MKRRTPQPSTRERSPEFKGVVKKIAGTLTNRPELEEEGRAEMSGRKGAKGVKRARSKLDPDPWRRG